MFSRSEVVDKANVQKFRNFSDILKKLNLNSKSKVSRPRQQKLCVVRQGAFSLVKLSTNENRARESEYENECDTNLPGTQGKKKMKSPINQA